MKACPNCKGRATKILSLTHGTITCQQCGHIYPVAADVPRKVRTKLPRPGELRDRAILGGEPSL